MVAQRYVLDPLYGVIHPPPYVWELMLTPELQRLREIRMCNVNSLCITGASAVTRYEHVVGTAHLAERCLLSWPGVLPPDATRRIILAALLHDLKTAPFGHSVEYLLAGVGFSHESLEGFEREIVSSYQGGFPYWTSSADGVFFGEPRALHARLKSDDISAIDRMIGGGGPYGPLISGKGIDLDNIDNVYRMAYHMGICNPESRPVQLAQALSCEGGVLRITPAAQDLVQHWYDTRRRLYEYLLLNPDEFSAKCMLQRSLEDYLQANPGAETRTWAETDLELVLRLHQDEPPDRAWIKRLMNGGLFGCIGIYATRRIEAVEKYRSCEARRELERTLSQALSRGRRGESYDVALHLIWDVNKTERRITLATTEGSTITMGRSTSRVLIGAFLTNRNQMMHQLTMNPAVDGHRMVVHQALADAIGDQELQEVDLFGEAYVREP